MCVYGGSVEPVVCNLWTQWIYSITFESSWSLFLNTYNWKGLILNSKQLYVTGKSKTLYHVLMYFKYSRLYENNINLLLLHNMLLQWIIKVWKLLLKAKLSATAYVISWKQLLLELFILFFSYLLNKLAVAVWVSNISVTNIAAGVGNIEMYISVIQYYSKLLRRDSHTTAQNLFVFLLFWILPGYFGAQLGMLTNNTSTTIELCDIMTSHFIFYGIYFGNCYATMYINNLLLTFVNYNGERNDKIFNICSTFWFIYWRIDALLLMQ